MYEFGCVGVRETKDPQAPRKIPTRMSRLGTDWHEHQCEGSVRNLDHKHPVTDDLSRLSKWNCIIPATARPFAVWARLLS